MIVQCAACQTRFKIADEKVTDRGVKVRCTKCANTFVVRKDGPAPAPDAPPVSTAAKAPAAAPSRISDPFAPITRVGPPPADPFAPVTRVGPAPADPFAAFGPSRPAPSLEQSTNPGLFLGDLSDFESDDESAFKEVTRVGVSLAHIQATRPDAPPLAPVTTPKQSPAIAAAPAPLNTPDPFAGFRLDASGPKTPPPGGDPFGGAAAGSDPFALKPPAAGDPFALKSATPPATGKGNAPPAADPFGVAATAPTADPFGGGLSAGEADPFSSGAFDFGGSLELGGSTNPAQDPFAQGGVGGDASPLGQTSRADFDFDTSLGSGLELDQGGPAPGPRAAPAPLERTQPAPAPTAPKAEPKPEPKPEPKKVAAPAEDAPAGELVHPRSAAAKRKEARPKSTTSALLNALVYAAIGLGLLAAVFVAQNDGNLSLSELSVETALKTLAGKGAGDYPVRSVSNGLYETRTGRPVFYVRGQVENRTDSSRQLRVQVELVSGSDALRRTDGVAGALPTPEELFELTDAAASTRLRERLARRGVPVEPGSSQEFLVVFYEFPDDLPDLKLKISAEPHVALAAATPPPTEEKPGAPQPAAPAATEAPVAAAAEAPAEPPAQVTGSRKKKSKSKPVPPLPDFTKEPPRKLLINSGKPGPAAADR